MNNITPPDESQEEGEELNLPDLQAADQWWNSLLVITRKTFKKILDEGGKNAGYLWLLYSKYVDTARAQKTNTVWARNTYLARGLSWERKTVIKYNKLLKRMGLIEKVVRRDPAGRITGTFTKITGIGRKEINGNLHSTVSRECGSDGSVGEIHTNALTNKGEVLDLYNRNTASIIELLKIPQEKIDEAITKCGVGHVIDWLEKMECRMKFEELRDPTAVFMYYVTKHMTQNENG
ncbi:hypothetical protein ES703_66043 [subsurface metagenome]